MRSCLSPRPVVVNANDNLWVTRIWLLLMRLTVACGYVDDASIYFSAFPSKKKPQFDDQRWNLGLLASQTSPCLSELGGGGEHSPPRSHPRLTRVNKATSIRGIRHLCLHLCVYRHPLEAPPPPPPWLTGGCVLNAPRILPRMLTFKRCRAFCCARSARGAIHPASHANASARGRARRWRRSRVIVTPVIRHGGVCVRAGRDSASRPGRLGTDEPRTENKQRWKEQRCRGQQKTRENIRDVVV